MKRTIALILVLLMVFSALVACSKTETKTETTEAKTETKTEVNWPTQPVNVVCPAAAGGGTDNILRLMNEYFVKKTGQSFVIDNITGIAGYEKTYQANTDGYNFICGTTTIFTSELDGTLSYDWDDYELVSFWGSPYNGSCVAVRADSPYQTINELLDAAKADPSSVTGGITLTGQPLMIVQALQTALGYELYTTDVGNAGERNAALLGGHVDWILNNTSSCDPYVQSGDFRILAVCGEQRLPTNPDVPTFKDAGVDFAFPAQPMVWLAPKGTPKEVCEAFNKILREINDDENYKNDLLEKLKSLGYDIPDVEGSIKAGEEYKAALAPFVKKSK